MIGVVPCDPASASTSESLRDEYAAALAAAGVAVVAIEHVISTSVPGLAAEPTAEVVFDGNLACATTS